GYPHRLVGFELTRVHAGGPGHDLLPRDARRAHDRQTGGSGARVLRLGVLEGEGLGAVLHPQHVAGARGVALYLFVAATLEVTLGVGPRHLDQLGPNTTDELFVLVVFVTLPFWTAWIALFFQGRELLGVQLGALL